MTDIKSNDNLFWTAHDSVRFKSLPAHLRKFHFVDLVFSRIVGAKAKKQFPLKTDYARIKAKASLNTRQITWSRRDHDLLVKKS